MGLIGKIVVRKPSEIDNFRASIEFQLEAMHDLLRVLEEGIREIRIKEATSVYAESRINLLSAEGIKKWKSMTHHQQIYGFELPIRVRYSFALQLYTLFEVGGCALCDEIKQRKSLSVSIDDLAGGRSYSGIRIFFSKIFPVSGIEWSQLENLKDIRNCVSHYAGVAKDSKQEPRLKRLAAKLPKKIRLLESGYVFLSRDYCADLLDAVKRFFENVFTTGGFGKKGLLYQIGHAQELIEILRKESLNRPKVVHA